MCIFKAIYKKAFPIPPVDSFNTYLVVSPHPDDSDVGCGGLIAKLARLGKKVVVLNCTDGRYGDVDHYRPDELAEIRRVEDQNARKAYGGDVSAIYFDYHDGGDYDEIALAKEIAKVIVQVKPDVLLVPDHTTISECHPDHLKVGRAGAYSIIIASDYGMMVDLGVSDKHEIKEVAFYYTDRQTRKVKLKKEDLETQIKAIQCHTSQLPEGALDQYKLFFKIRAIRCGLKCGAKYAEGYRVLTNFLSHCVPEATEL